MTVFPEIDRTEKGGDLTPDSTVFVVVRKIINHFEIRRADICR